MSMPYTPSRLRNAVAPPQRKGHFANKSLPVCPTDVPVTPIRPSVDSYRKQSITPVSVQLSRSRRSEDDFGVVVRPFPESPTSSSFFSSSSSSSCSSMPNSSIRPASSSSIPPRVSFLNPTHNLSSSIYMDKPLPNPHRDTLDINDFLCTSASPHHPSHVLQTKANWMTSEVFDPRDYSIEPMSHWSDDSDDSDAETEKEHKRGSGKLFDSWRRSRTNKTAKPSTNNLQQPHRHNHHLDDEVMNNLARMQ